MLRYHLIVVGSLKDKHLENIEQQYLKRLNRFQLIIHEVKASAENKGLESKNIQLKIDSILKKENSYQVVLLTENGKQYDSPEFALYIDQQFYQQSKSPIFVIAGAEGFSQDLLKSYPQKMSLSPMTFPHKLARIILVEQLYRAQCISAGHPYHN
jgi:23S rRNA (pseudouridine1915-N3)-methyltransferase